MGSITPLDNYGSPCSGAGVLAWVRWTIISDRCSGASAGPESAPETPRQRLDRSDGTDSPTRSAGRFLLPVGLGWTGWPTFVMRRSRVRLSLRAQRVAKETSTLSLGQATQMSGISSTRAWLLLSVTSEPGRRVIPSGPGVPSSVGQSGSEPRFIERGRTDGWLLMSPDRDCRIFRRSADSWRREYRALRGRWALI
jgi:hypothetical protein